MKICIDTRALSYGSSYSGVYVYAKNIIERMITGHSEHQFTCLDIGRKRHSISISKERKNIKNFWIPFPNNALNLFQKTCGLPHIDTFQKSDVYFSPHLHALPLKYPEKHALMLYDLSFLHYPEFFSKRYNSWHAMQDVKTHAQKAGKIITISDYSKYDISRTLNIPEERIVVAEPGIQDDFFEWDEEKRNKFRTEQGIKNPFIFFTGTLEPRKNIEGAIQAFNILKKNAWAHDIQIFIAGSKGWLYDTIFREADASPFRGDIKFLGAISNEMLVGFYNAASCFLYPSYFEGFGMPPLEAQACGVPVVVSNRSSFPEAVGSSGLMVNPWKPDEIAYALEIIFQNDELRKELIQRGFQNIKKFSWEKTAERIFNALLTLHGTSEISNKKH